MHSTTLDDDVRKIVMDKIHQWTTFVSPGYEPNYQYCTRCAQRQDELKIGNDYLPCKGFI